MIQLLKAKCGSGKTHRYLIPRLLADTETRFIVAVPQLAILDEIQAAVAKHYGIAAYPHFTRIDSSTGTENVAQSLAAEFACKQLSARIIAITHASLWTLSPSMTKGRVLLIDETPELLKFIPASQDTWRDLTESGEITAEGGIITVTAKGLLRIERRGVGKIDLSKQDVLRQARAVKTKILSTGYAYQQVNPAIFEQAAEVVIMAASHDTKCLPEYLNSNGLQTTQLKPAAFDSHVSTHHCPNTEIYFAFDNPKLASLAKLKNEYLTPLTNLMNSIKSNSHEGSLFHPSGSGKYLVAANEATKRALGRYLDKSRIVSPVIRGVNEYADCDVMIFLAGMQPGPRDIESILEIHNGRSRADIVAAQHVDAMYQFILRSVLRVNEKAQVKILVTTKGDALALASLLGTAEPRQCTPQPSNGRGRFGTRRLKVAALETT